MCSYLSSEPLTIEQIVDVAQYMKLIVPPDFSSEQVCQLIIKSGVYDPEGYIWNSQRRRAEAYIEGQHSLKFRKYHEIYARRLELILNNRDARAIRENMTVLHQIEELTEFLQDQLSAVYPEKTRHFYYLLLRLRHYFLAHPPDPKMNQVLVNALATRSCNRDSQCRMYLKVKDGIRKSIIAHNSRVGVALRGALALRRFMSGG
jgi:hypothetical protein